MVAKAKAAGKKVAPKAKAAGKKAAASKGTASLTHATLSKAGRATGSCAPMSLDDKIEAFQKSAGTLSVDNFLSGLTTAESQIVWTKFEYARGSASSVQEVSLQTSFSRSCFLCVWLQGRAFNTFGHSPLVTVVSVTVVRHL